MRKDFVTNFWQNAYEKLPAGVRGQYLTQMKAAESWELAIGDLIKVGSRVKNAIARVFQAPKAKRA
jgi:hypothetical protein